MPSCLLRLEVEIFTPVIYYGDLGGIGREREDRHAAWRKQQLDRLDLPIVTSL